MNYRVIVTIVPRGRGEQVALAAVAGGAGGGTVLMGKGAAPSAALQLLGLGETARDVTLTIAEETKARAVMDAVEAEVRRLGCRFGVMFSVGADAFARSGFPGGENEGEKGGDMAGRNAGTGYKMVNVIVNRGYAEDAMAAARKAGASGGTILPARGTAREDDAEFFGVRLVPEKEMLLIVVEDAKYEAVFSAIRSLPCFAEKGSGIEFSFPASDFTTLGAR